VAIIFTFKPSAINNMKKIYLLSFLVFNLSLLTAQKIEFKGMSVIGGDQIEVKYFVQGLKFNKSFNVSLYYSIDKGQNYVGPLMFVSGDAGSGIKNGMHAITWDALKEIDFLEKDLIFDVRGGLVEQKIEKSLFVSYVGNSTTYLGLRVGSIGKIGWYIEGRMNLLGFETSNYDYENGLVKDYNKPGYYEFNGNNGYSALFAGGGVTYQAARDLFIFVGAGYGKENYLYEIDDFSYENDAKTGTSYIKDPDSNEGVEVDAGIIYRFRKLLLTGGAATINFNTMNWTAGIGYSF
jgi:hypothetical protein